MGVQTISHHSNGNMQRHSPSQGVRQRAKGGEGDKPHPTHRQGMYENSCINLSSHQPPDSNRGQRENDAKERLNPMSKIRQPNSCSLPTGPGSWVSGLTGGCGGALWGGVRPALAWPFSIPGLCGGERGGSWAEALSMYIYIHSSAPGWGSSAESSAENFPSGRRQKRTASAVGGNRISPSQACGS